ncbi:MAG: sulfite exporter TauE/SafE family protein [Bacteroidales bacterium]|nr:sulfite exporter TauE/SafE family protein [Bacteroidales bacterium]
MDYLTGLLENSNFPLLTALVLGLMTAISPCPLATNITAVGFISKDIQSRNRVFINGLVYTLGRSITYVLLALILFYSADQFKISGFIQMYGEKILGPLLILIGIFMLGIVKINFPALSSLTGKVSQKGFAGYWDVLLLGIVFALAFCPYSGVLYFGMLIPLTVSSSEGILLPFVFAIATGIPVIIFAWLIAYTVSGVGSFYNKLKNFEIWFRRVIAVVFIGVGIYYVWITLI